MLLKLKATKQGVNERPAHKMIAPVFIFGVHPWLVILPVQRQLAAIERLGAIRADEVSAGKKIQSSG